MLLDPPTGGSYSHVIRMQTVCPIHIPLPLEVEERIIDILESDVKALRVCALTCRAWRIRSRIHLFKAIRLTDRPRLDVLSHHLQGLPFLATAIREMTIESSDVILAPLSLRLPSLRLLHVRDATLAYHHSALHAMKATSQLGALYLTRATFYTAMDFVRFIGALPGLRELRCHHVTMKSIKTTNTESILQKTVTIISKRCRISTLQVSGEFVLKALLLPLLQMTCGVLEDLTMVLDCKDIPDFPNLPKLRSITLDLSLRPQDALLALNVVRKLHTVCKTYTLVLSADYVGQCIFVAMDDSNRSSAAMKTRVDGLYTMIEQLEARSPESVKIAVRDGQQNLRDRLDRMLHKKFSRLALEVVRDADSHSTRPGSTFTHGHSGYVNCLTFSPDGLWAASSGGGDNILILWDARKGTISREWYHCGTWFEELAFSPNSDFLAALHQSQPGTLGVLIYRIHPESSEDRPKQLGVWQADKMAIVWSPNETTLLTISRLSPSVLVWDVSKEAQPSGGPVAHFNLPHPSSIFTYDYGPLFTPDGRRLLYYGGPETGHTWYLYDVESWTVHRRFRNADQVSPYDWPLHPLHVSFDASGTLLVVLYAGYAMEVIDLAGSQQPRLARLQPVRAGMDTALAVGMSQDRTKALYTGVDGEVTVWGVPSGRLLSSFRVTVGTRREVGAVERVAFAPDGRRVVFGFSTGVLRVYDVTAGECVGFCNGHSGGVTQMAFAPTGPDGEVLCSADWFGVVRFQCVGHLRSHRLRVHRESRRDSE